MKPWWPTVLVLGALLGARPSPADGHTVYEGFDAEGLFDGEPLGTAVGATSTGFAPDSAWDFLMGTATTSYLEEGLTYLDRDGNELATSGGALRVVPDGEALLGRSLAEPLVERPGTYWVSYLMRLDTPDPGNLYWTPDATWQVGAAGLQGTHDFRFVNGNFARDELGLIQASTGQAHLVVVQVNRAEGDGSLDTAQLWIDPLLTDPGPAQALHGSTSFFDSIRDGSDFLMLVGERFGSTYTIDELRIADSFELVAPLAGGPDQVCGDFDSDGDVDAFDFTTLILGWTGGLPPGTGGRTFAEGDCDADADVDASDMTSVIIGWTGSKAGPMPAGAAMAMGPFPAVSRDARSAAASVPEPSGWAVILVTLAWLAHGRRRSRRP